MNVRVTTQMQTANAIAYQQQQYAALAKYQDEISSGLRVKLPSDDPGQFPALSQAKASSLRFATYTQTMSDATSDLNASVSALQDTNDVLVRAREIALEGANNTTGPNDSEALAKEVDSLIGRALYAANSQQDGKYLFSGTALDTPPFSVATTTANGQPATIAYNGSADRSRVLIGPGQTVETRYAGSVVFQQAGTDVFQALIGLRDDLRNTTLTDATKAQVLTTRLGQIDAARNAIGQTTGEQSSSLASLQALQARVTDLKLASDIRSGEIEGTDYADAVVKMQAQQTALQATLAISARILQPNLLDFIK